MLVNQRRASPCTKKPYTSFNTKEISVGRREHWSFSGRRWRFMGTCEGPCLPRTWPLRSRVASAKNGSARPACSFAAMPPSPPGNIRVALARAFLLAGDFPRTEAALEQIIAQDQAPHTILERRVSWVWGELALARHQPDVALRLADALIASAPGEAQRAAGQPIPALLKLRGEALFALGQVEEAIHALEEARRGAQDWEALPLLWQIHRALGRAYARTRQKPFAHQAFAAAREVIENVAASLDETELRERFLDTALASLPKEHPLTLRQSVTHAFGRLSER